MEQIAATRCLDDHDKEFNYKRSNDSHKWIIDYPAKLKADPNTLKISSKNEDFIPYERPLFVSSGKRKKMLEVFYRKIISEEIFGRAGLEEVVIEEYKSESMDRYRNPDDMPLPGECLSKNEKLKQENKAVPKKVAKETDIEELKTKYPLYMSAPMTFFAQVSGRANFRKNSTITKSADRNYDNIEY